MRCTHNALRSTKDMTKIKICGITNLKDAKAAVKLGADYLGFIFYRKSPRYIRPEKAQDIISKLPKKVKTVGVFVNEKVDAVKRIARITGIRLLQFHGDETQGYCKEFKLPVIKALRIKGEKDLRKINDYDVDFFLLDNYLPNKFGGTGKRFDWGVLSKIKRINKKFFLSGGINPENVVLAIRNVSPFAADASSGLEKSLGKKDHKIMKKLFYNIKNYKYLSKRRRV